MCDPASASYAMLALTAASTASQVAAQQSAADSQNTYNRVQTNNLLIARSQNANQVGLERQQAGEAASQKINENNQALRSAQSSVVAQGGPSGLSVDALLSDMATKGSGYNQSVTNNLQSTNLALDNQLQNVNNSAASAINQLKTPNPVDYLGAGLRIGSSYMQTKVPGSGTTTNA